MTAKSSRIPFALRERVFRRDGYACVGAKLGWPSHQRRDFYRCELDHVRPSGGLSMKSPTTEDNLVSLCAPNGCHEFKTNHGREARPQLIAYLSRWYPEKAA